MTEEVQSKEQEELGPYRGSYRSEVYADQPEPEATLKDEDQETSLEDEESISLKTEIKTEEHDYKKRYDDLKKHYDSKLMEWRDEKESLVNETENSSQNYDDPDLEEFKEAYPDVYNVVETLSAKKTAEEVQELRNEIERLSRTEKNLKVKGAYQELLALHPDFAEIKKSDEFKAWLQEQPPSISDGILKNNEDVRWASRILDLYKADTGPKTKRGRPRKDTSSAADVVRMPSAISVSTESGKNKKVWTTSEIRKLKPHEFDKLEAELDQANAEGRIVKQ